ncbi:Copia protein [Symbiodinium microadriaticum]|uniref:Copia protein n=1 Tax=Symbiodinium microadriaticum TaxID=2951 RepID=A0A1Q9EKP6_SYMMI|nr:Copia protein [Symbiodinium microadriaticum]
MLRAENGELITDQEEVEPHDEEAAPSAVTPADLEQDVQPDLSTTLVGWDFSRGDPAEFPVDSLRDSDLSAFLDERGMRCELGRLNFLGVDDPEDLQYLYEEDLIEMGMPRSQVPLHSQVPLYSQVPEVRSQVPEVRSQVGVTIAQVKEHIAEWIPAAKSEVEALEQMGAIIRLVGSDANAEMKAPGTQVLPAKTVFTVKPGSGGNYFRRKCRVVGCGNFESKSNDLDLYAGGIPADVLRTCLVEASSRKLSAFITDIKNAFLLAPIPQAERTRIMLRPPKILEAMNITQPGELWWVDRAVYGLRQSPRWWGEHRDAVLAEAKWPSKRYGNLCLRQSGVEGNLWKMTTTSNEIVGFVIVYVDDMMFLSTPDDAAGLHMWVKSQWECTPLEQATTSHAVTFLGVEVHVETLETGESGFALCQRAYIQELARSYGITTRGRLAPVPKDWVRELPEPEAQPSVDVIRKAQRITGEVLWVAQRSRPDISYCVSLMGSWITKVPSLVSKMGVRLIEFLFSTIDQTLSLTPKHDVGPGLRVYSDASFAPFGSKSVSGILLQFRGRNVLWKGQRQTLVCLSTAEAELVAAVEGVVLSQSLRALISEFELRLGVTELYVDNTAAIVLAEGGGSTRTRASAEEEEIERGIGPELSLIIVMMALSVLFVWEEAVRRAIAIEAEGLRRRSQLKRGGIVVAGAGLALSGLLLLRIVGGAAALTLGRRLRYLRGLRILRAVRYLLPLAVVSRAFRRRNTDDAK